MTVEKEGESLKDQYLFNWYQIMTSSVSWKHKPRLHVYTRIDYICATHCLRAAFERHLVKRVCHYLVHDHQFATLGEMNCAGTTAPLWTQQPFIKSFRQSNVVRPKWRGKMRIISADALYHRYIIDDRWLEITCGPCHRVAYSTIHLLAIDRSSN